MTTLRRLVLILASTALLMSLGSFGWTAYRWVTTDASAANVGLAMGMLGITVFACAATVLYLLDKRRDSRRLRSTATYSRLAAQRTRQIASNSSRTVTALKRLTDRPLPPSMAYLDRRFRQLAESFAEQSTGSRTAVAASTERIIEKLQDLSIELSALRATTGELKLTQELDKAMDRVYALIEGLVGTYTIGPDSPLAPMRGWAISPDLAALLVSLIAVERPRMILEVGSGVSTAIMAMALSRQGGGSIVALEHEASYAQKTNAMLIQHGVEEVARVVHAPLVDHEINGQGHLWYDTGQLDFAQPLDLIVIDGPPRTVGPKARYPALHLLRDHLHSETVVVLDDTNRKDEIEMISSWAEEIAPLDVDFLPHEKGTAVIRLRKG